jgi:sec-independent protein translocase protein TatC
MNKSTILEHLLELRNRLMWVVGVFVIAFIAAYIFKTDIYSFLVQPLADNYVGDERRMIFTGLTEAFFTYVNLSFFTAFIISFPFIAFQAYRFLAPGLYKNEKSMLYPFVFLSPILFLLGAAFVYYFIMPLALEFFISFESGADETDLPIQLEAKVSEYLSFVTHMIIGFGLAFQLPIILLLLAKTGLVKLDFLQRNRKIAVVIILIAAAILTPPDVISQSGLAVVLYGLYELSILAIRRKS